MKITILQGAFLTIPPTLGGAVEKMWFALGKEFVKQGHEVVHISRKVDNSNEESIDGVKHIRISGYDMPTSAIKIKLYDLIYTLRSKRVIPNDTDILVTNTFWSPIVLPNKIRSKCFVDVQRMPKGQMKWYAKSAVLRANSSSVVAAIKKETSVSLQRKVTLIPNPLPFEISKNVELDQKEKIILYVGRIHPEKGIDMLLSAYRKIDDQWQLKIIGPWKVEQGGGGSIYLDKLKKIAEGTNAEFIEPVYDIEKLNTYYQKASIFVYPSVAEKGETFGLAPLEAMAWGCVPIVSALACFQDFITHQHNGLIFNHRDGVAIKNLSIQLNTLISDHHLRSRVAEAALLVNQSHSIETTANQFLAAFKKII